MKQQWTSEVWGVALLVAAAAGCSSNADTSQPGGTGATPAGSPATSTGTAGKAAGAAGTGTTTGAASGPFACGPKSTKSGPELYAAMAGAFLPQDATNMLPCAFSSCHNMGKKAAMLALPFGGDLTGLVGKKSCEVPTMDLVATGGGDAALMNSWLWHKLAGPVDGSAALVPDPAWGMAGSCGQSDAAFGMRMPISSGADGVGEAKLAIARDWICGGAPGPM